MKKLMTMIASVAMAFGLYADGYQKLGYTIPAEAEVGANTIAGYADDMETPLDEGVTVNWWATGCLSDGGYQPAAVAEDDVKGKILAVDSDTDKPLIRTFNAIKNLDGSHDALTIEDHGLFIDTKVKFTGAEDVLTTPSDAKILVWLKTIETEMEGEVVKVEGSTNLMVTCGIADVGEIIGCTNLALVAEVENGSWHQLTIRANKGTKYATFNIYLDGEQLATADGVKEFPALIGDNNTLASVGYAGTGAFQTVDLCGQTDAPAWAADPTVMNIVWDANVESITIDGDNIIDGQTSPFAYTVPFGEEITATIAYKQGYRKSSVTGPGLIDFSETDGVATFKVAQYATVADAQLIVESELARDEATITVNDVDVTDIAGTSVDKILAYIAANCGENDSVKITLGDKTSLGNVEVTTLNNLLGFTGTIEIDLHGCTLTANAEDATADDYLFYSDGVMTISDSVGGGSIVAQTGTAGIVYNDSALTLSAVAEGKDGIFYDGAIINDCWQDEEPPYEWFGGILHVNGGIFSVKPTTNVEGHLDDGIELPQDMEWKQDAQTGYWYLDTAEPPVPGETFTVTVPALTEGLTITSIVTNSVPVVSPAAGTYTLNEGELFTMTYAPDEGYKFTDDSETGVREAEKTKTIDPPAVEAIPVVTGFAIIIAGDPAVTNYYPTLDKAIEEYTGEGVVALMADSLDLDHCIAIDKDVIFDLNGYTLAAVNGSSAAGVFAVRHGGFLTINDSSAGKTGAIDGSAVPTAIKMTQNATDTDDTKLAKLVVNGGTITGYNYGIGGNGNAGRGNTAVEINGGKITAVGVDAEGKADSCAIFNPQAGTLVINDGEIEAGMGIIIKSGSLTVNGGSIKATGEAAAWVKKTNGFSNTGDAIEVDNIGYPGESPVVEIKGGEIVSANNAAVASRYDGVYEQITGFVTGGEFTGNAPMDNALAGGGYAFPAFQPGVPQTLVDAVAKVNDVNYATLAAALDAAVEGDTVTLVKDSTETATTEIDKEITLDLNGKALTYTGCSGLCFTADGTVMNGTVNVVVENTDNKAIAIEFLDADGLVENVAVNSGYAKYGVVASSNDDFGNKLVECENVDATGSGMLFYAESNAMTLDEDCTGTQTGAYAAGESFSPYYSGTLAAGWLGELTVNGGTYTAEGRVVSAMSSPATIVINDGTFTGDFELVPVTDSYKEKFGRDHVVVISDGDFSDTEIPVEYIKPVEHKVAKWVASTIDGYVTPGYDWVQVKAIWVVDDVATTNLVDYNTVPVQPEDPVKTGYTFTGWQPTPGDAITEDTTYTAQFEATTYTISYTFTGVEAGDVEKIVNNNPTTYTIESETITFADASCEGYTFKGWDIAKIDAGSTGNKTITGTFEKAEDPLPSWVPSGEKEAYNTWKMTGPGATPSDFTGDPEVVAEKMEDSFLLNCAPTEAVLQTAKDNFKITSITKDASGNWVVLTVGREDNTTYGNGLIKLKAFENVGCTGTPVTPADQSQLFWKASLVHPTANE